MNWHLPNHKCIQGGIVHAGFFSFDKFLDYENYSSKKGRNHSKKEVSLIQKYILLKRGF